MKNILLAILILVLSGNLLSQTVIKNSMITTDCGLYAKAALGGKPVIYLNKGDSVGVLSLNNIFYKVQYKDMVGFINSIYINDPELEKTFFEINNNKIKESNSKKLVELLKKYNEFDANCIVNMRVEIGMSKQAAFEILGSPNSVNRTVTQHSIDEQCVYDDGNFKSRYFYFSNNKLTSYQD